MKRNNRQMQLVYLLAACILSIMVAACQSGPAVSGDSTPMVQPVDAMVFQYQLAKPKPISEDTRPLGNTKWQVASITPKPRETYATVVFDFQPDGNLLETTTYGDGSVKSETSRYHIVGSTMIINKPKNDVNARFRVEGNSLIMDTGEYSMLLRRVN